VTGFPKSVRELITTRANGACERCGMAAPAYQIHHRRPRGMGGSTSSDTNRASNGLWVCVSCHSDIEANREDALRFGWLVRQGQSPADVKVLRRGTWVQLADDGWMH
jgi:hypothetical protein